MSPTAIFLFKWLQQNASSRAKSGTDAVYSETRAERMGGLLSDLLETSGCVGGRGVAGMDMQEGGGEEAEGGQLVMNLTESCLCRRQKPGRPQNCSSEDSQVLTDELLQPCDGHRAQTARECREGRRGEEEEAGVRGVIYLPSMSLFMDRTTGDGLKPLASSRGRSTSFSH